MNDFKKWDWFFIGAFIIIFVLALLIGFFIGRGRNSYKIADAEATVNGLTDTVKELNETVSRANIENRKLRAIFNSDKETIGNLRAINITVNESNRKTTKLFEEQGQLINQLTIGNNIIRESGGTITEGLSEAIQAVDNLIKDIQSREN